MSINDIRFALKQQELRRAKRREEKTSREYETMRQVKERELELMVIVRTVASKGTWQLIVTETKNASTVRELTTLLRIAVNRRETQLRRGNLQGGYRRRNAKQYRGRDESI